MFKFYDNNKIKIVLDFLFSFLKTLNLQLPTPSSDTPSSDRVFVRM